LNLNADNPLFDVYIPTRTGTSVEVRLRSSLDGAVSLSVNQTTVRIDAPSITYENLHFYRQTFSSLSPGTICSVEAHHLRSGFNATVKVTTLMSPSSEPKLRIGIMADPHIPLGQGSIEQYHPGTKRLSGLAHQLTEKYMGRLEKLGADIIVLPGDLVDPCTPQTLRQVQKCIDSVTIPCYPIIGNHEPWTPGGERLFYRTLGLPEGGYYAVRRNGTLLIFLSTPVPESLNVDTRQYRWLEEQLAASDPDDDIILFSHFSLLLHPCVQGFKNDGYQLLDNHRRLLDLITGYPNVRLFIAGHKNVPSQVVRNGIIHTLSPQLIQVPCGYDLFTLFDKGVMRITFEIDEQHYCEVARAAYKRNWLERYGEEEGRNFYLSYDDSVQPKRLKK
jgi:hypothetical protein